MKNEENFLLIIPQSMQKIVLSHLEKYARFSKCTINNGQEQDLPLPLTDKKNIILNGIPTIYPETSEQIIAQRLNLHLIDGAISFKKGCYLGQEIISRLHFKGKLKHHMYLGTAPKNILLALNDEIKDSAGNTTGFVVDFCVNDEKNIILFVNNIENKMPLIKSDQLITLLPLPYSFRDEAP